MRPSLPRLPDELILEILRDQALSQGDLAALSLLSRRFLDQVRRFLYETVNIVVVDEHVEYGIDGLDGETSMQLVYSKRTWRLLRTMQDSPKLAALVDHLRFRSDISWISEREIGGIATSPRVAYSTFLRLARKATKVSAHDSRRLQETILQSANCKHITYLDIDHPADVSLARLSDLLPNLNHLKLGTLPTALPDAPLFRRLSSLSICSSTATLLEAPFLLSTRFTLRRLRVNLNILIALSRTHSLSDFALLDYLHVYTATMPVTSANSDTEYTQIVSFWSLICRSTSLRTLSFDGRTFNSYEYGLFYCQLLQIGVRDLDTLQTIRFENDIPVDRLAAILGWSEFPALRYIVLPVNTFKEEVDTRRRKVAAVTAMCEGTGIEVMLSD